MENLREYVLHLVFIFFPLILHSVLGDDREMSYREQFELDKKSRHENNEVTSKQSVVEEKSDSKSINKTSENENPGKKAGSFFDKLDWQDEEEPLKESSDSDHEWDALRSGNTQNKSNNATTKTFDFFSEAKGNNNEASFDLFNMREEEKPSDSNDTSEDLLGLSEDNTNKTEETLPSPRPRKGTRHSSLGDDQLQSDFDLLNLSSHSKEESEVDLLGLNSTGLKRNKSANDIIHTSPKEDDIFTDLRSPINNSNTSNQSSTTQSNTTQSNTTQSNTFDPFSQASKSKNVDLFGDLGTNTSSGPVLAPQVNTSWNQNPSASQKTTSNDPFADFGSLGSSKLNGNAPPPTGSTSESFSSFQKKSSSPTPTSKSAASPAPTQQSYGFQNGGQANSKVQKPNYAPSYSTAGGSSVFGTYGLRDGYGKLFFVCLIKFRSSL